jgi:hypothetical protein
VGGLRIGQGLFCGTTRIGLQHPTKKIEQLDTWQVLGQTSSRTVTFHNILLFDHLTAGAERPTCRHPCRAGKCDRKLVGQSLISMSTMILMMMMMTMMMMILMKKKKRMIIKE